MVSSPGEPIGPGGQAGVLVGVVRRRVGPLGRRGADVALPLADVGHRRVELERHPLVRAGCRARGRPWGSPRTPVRLVLEDARDRQHLLGGEADLLGLGREVERLLDRHALGHHLPDQADRASASAAPCRSPGTGSPRGCRSPRPAARSPSGWRAPRSRPSCVMSVLSTIVLTIWRTRAPSGTTTRLWIRLSGSTRTSSASLAFICFLQLVVADLDVAGLVVLARGLVERVDALHDALRLQLAADVGGGGAVLDLVEHAARARAG